MISVLEKLEALRDCVKPGDVLTLDDSWETATATVMLPPALKGSGNTWELRIRVWYPGGFGFVGVDYSEWGCVVGADRGKGDAFYSCNTVIQVNPLDDAEEPWGVVIGQPPSSVVEQMEALTKGRLIL